MCSWHDVEPVTVLLNVWGGDSLRSLRRSIASVLAQTHQPTELLIVADGPLDADVTELLESLQGRTSTPVRIVNIECATGLSNARNTGLRHSKTELVALQDADDVMHPQRLQIQVEEMISHQIDVLSSDAFEFDDQSEVIIGCRQSPHNREQLIKRLLLNNPFNHSTVMIRRSSVLACGGYRNVYLVEDYDLWLRMASQGYTLVIGKEIIEALSVDWRFLDRRGGWRFIKSELILDKVITQEFWVRPMFRTKRLLARLLYRLGPTFLRHKVNSRILSNPRMEKPADLDEFITTPPRQVR